MAFEDIMKLMYKYDDVNIFDPTSIDIKSFKWVRGYTKHKLTRQEIIKPYLISYAYFDNKELWYYILLLNSVVDIDNLEVGAEIWIPNLSELNEFILNNKKKNT